MAKKSRPRNQRPAKKTTSHFIYSTARGYLQSWWSVITTNLWAPLMK